MLGLVAALVLVLGCAPVVSEPRIPELEQVMRSSGDGGLVAGVVKDSSTGEAIESALVVLQCACLPESQERFTDERGIYSFTKLPEGNYTIQVLIGKANVSTVTELPKAAKFKANFAVDPEQDNHVIWCGVGSEPRSTPIYLRTTAGNSLRDAFEASPY